MRQAFKLLGLALGLIVVSSKGAIAQSLQPTPPLPTPPSPHSPTLPATAAELDLDPTTIENSPVLQRWLQEVPNVQSDIRHDPAFRTRVRLGFSNLSSGDSGVNVGIEDVFVGRSGITASADYQTAHDRQSYGAEARYYVLPLGSYVNVAPTVGYRHVESDRDSVDGANLGVRLLFSLSRTGAADASLSQSFVAPGTADEVGITTLSFGYALTRHLRLSTDLQQQNAPHSKDHRVGVSLEWML